MVRVAPPVVATPATPENVIVPSFAATPDAPLLAKLTSSAPSSNRPLWRAVKVSAAVERRPMTAGASSIRFHAVSNAVAMASKLSPALKDTDGPRPRYLIVRVSAAAAVVAAESTPSEGSPVISTLSTCAVPPEGSSKPTQYTSAPTGICDFAAAYICAICEYAR